MKTTAALTSDELTDLLREADAHADPAVPAHRLAGPGALIRRLAAALRAERGRLLDLADGDRAAGFEAGAVSRDAALRTLQGTLADALDRLERAESARLAAEAESAELRKRIADEAWRLERLVDNIAGPAAARRVRVRVLLDKDGRQ